MTGRSLPQYSPLLKGELVDKTVALFGRLDVAVNNAGTEGKAGPVTEQTPESYAATFDTNVLGVLLSMKHETNSALFHDILG